MKSPIVICGATGNVGSKIAAALLAAGKPVRVVARNRGRLAALTARGAEARPGDIGDASFLGKALAGARSAFVMIPPKPDASDVRRYQNRVADALVSAVAAARVPHVVALSSIGAHLSEETGPILGLHDLEAKFERLPDTAVIHLRAAYFMENHLWGIPLVHARGIHGTLIRPDVPLPMIATTDIATVAAGLLRDPAFAGHGVRYLLGPRDLTMEEATRILGTAIGKPYLVYARLTEEEARTSMVAMGMSDDAASSMLEMFRGLNTGRIRPTRQRDAESATPTTLEEFAQTTFASAYRAAA